MNFVAARCWRSFVPQAVARAVASAHALQSTPHEDRSRRRGSDRRLLGGWLAAAGEDVTFIARGANLDAIRRERDAGRSARTAPRSSRARAAIEQHERGRPAGRGAAHGEGASGRRDRRRARGISVTTRPRSSRCRTAFRGGTSTSTAASTKASRCARRSRRSDRARSSIPTASSERGVSGGEARGARRGASRRRQPLHARRAGRLDDAARAGHLGGVHAGRIQGAGHRRHPQRDLAQAVGQPELQSDQRADARDARRICCSSRSRASWHRR